MDLTAGEKADSGPVDDRNIPKVEHNLATGIRVQNRLQLRAPVGRDITAEQQRDDVTVDGSLNEKCHAGCRDPGKATNSPALTH
jgi:hypothetical protein